MKSTAVDADHDPCIRQQSVGSLERLDVFVSRIVMRSTQSANVMGTYLELAIGAKLLLKWVTQVLLKERMSRPASKRVATRDGRENTKSLIYGFYDH